MKNSFNIDRIKNDFPIFNKINKGQNPLVYLDNSASTQKPKCVIDRLAEFYNSQNANVHRSFYELGQNATQMYENARDKVAHFINAKESDEIVFVRGATEGVNCIASLYGRTFLQEGDEILVSEIEHHSNLIPWLMIAKERKAVVKAIPVDANGNLEVERLSTLLTSRTKVMAITQVSNVLGTVTSLKPLIAEAHRNGTLVLVDAAQALAHMPLDVQDLDCDFLVGSGHKMYAPMGIGFFYGKRKWLEKLPAYHGGSNMMENVSLSDFSLSGIPNRFEAGTPHVAGSVGFMSAIEYMEQFTWQEILRQEDEVLHYAEKKLREMPEITVIGNPQKRTSVLSFNVRKVHPHDVATVLSTENIAVRAGHHCCQPLMKKFDLKGGTVRASFGIYNTIEDCNRLVSALQKTFKIFKV